MIIWDIVDAYNDKIGRIYFNDNGNRLVNVAISRAKSKLIIVGHNRIFHEGEGRDNVSPEIKKILSNAWTAAHQENV